MDIISDATQQEYLQHLDELYAIDNIPVMIFLGILMLFGLVGNSLVFFVYLTKLKPSTTRCFILALSLLDLIACAICVPIDIADLSCNYTFGEIGIIPCKLSTMLVTFTSYAAGNILIAVGAVRHKKVCYPTGSQTSIVTAKVAIFLSCLAGLGFSVPSAVLYGGQSKPTAIAGVNASLCTTSDEYINTPYPAVYNGFQFLTFVTATITLTTLYTRIWRKVSKFAEFKLWSWRHTDASCSGSENVLSDIPSGQVQSKTETTCDNSREKCKPIKHVELQKYPSKRQMSARRTTWMLFIITLTFVVSYLPHLSLMATRAVHYEVIDNLTGPSLAAYNFFLRSYFINCAVNPLIYSFCNTKVRDEIKAILSFKPCVK